uniref:non-ribosomal peptide synthetase n=1 Tax=Tenacibaculum ovolyticum TaxID=104270 RepID=UPI0004916139
MKKAQNNIEKIYPLTPMQEGMLFHTIRDKNLEAYFIQLSYSVSGKIDIEIFSESIDVLSKRHDIFRTAFVYESTERPIQVVLRNRKIALNILDKTTLHPSDYKNFIETFKDADVKKGFDLVKEPLVRLSIIKKGDDSYDFLWSFHHIIVDGWCNTIIVEELNEIYASLLHNRKIVLPEPVLYSTYIKWLEGKDTASTTKYWNTYLEGYNHIAEIPKITNTTTNVDLRNAVEKSILSKKTTAKLAIIAKSNTVTLNDIFQTFWGLILAKYSGSNDVVYGNVVSGRPPELHGMDRCLGLFMNTIPVRIHFKEEEALLDITKRVHDDFLEGTPYHYSSLVEIQNATPLKSNLIKHIIAFENYPIAQEDKEDILFEISNVNTFERTNYNFDLDVELGEEIEISFFYHPEVYHPELVKKIKNSFETLIHQFAENPNEKVENISFISKEDENELLYNFNNEAVDLKNNQPINVLFEEEVQEKPECIAITHNDVEWTYKKLNSRANQIANTLLKNGLEKGNFVGLHLERSPELIAALLGIFKAGGVYVPMDTQNPATRTLELLKDGELKALISEKEHLLALKGAALFDNELQQIICLDNDLFSSDLESVEAKIIVSSVHDIVKNDNNNPENVNEQSDWAYMLYTSGSTGKPKGAITRHNGALNHILAEYKALDLKDGFCFLQSASIASDISVWQILAPLLKGGKVLIADKDDVLDYQKTLDLMKEHNVTIAEFVPSYLIGFVDLILELNPQENILPSLEWMMMVGEEIPVKLVNDWLKLFPECKVLNGYGPCEASDDITQFEITEPLPLNTPKVSIGKPIDNMNIFVLDDNEKLVPIGIPGEICVSGIGVGAGYFKDAEKTAKSFRPNPFPKTLGDTMYKTGDLGRWLPNGNLEFLGRKDRQLKIRGNRVELGEIEALIRDSQLIENVAVVAHKKSPSDTPLIAFVIQKNKEETEFVNKYLDRNILQESNSDTLYATRIAKKESVELEKLLIEKCSKGLPSYMQPNEYVFVDKIPQNLSDKVDEKKLLAIYKKQINGRSKTLIDVEECKTSTEKIIKTIWGKVLQRKPIGASDDFFEKGGHSLLAMRVKSAIQKQMKIQLDIKDLFVYTKLNELAAHIDKEPISEEVNEITIQKRPERIPLSYAQERLWFIDTLEGSTEYNVSSVLQLKGNLNKTLLESSLREIVNRHETLRSLIKEDKDIPYLDFLSSENWTIDFKDSIEDTRLNEEIELLTSKPFNLAEDFKLRAHIIQQASNVNMLVLVMHHIASDGWSESILVEELLELYEAGINNKTPKLPELKIQYTDYILWQQKKKHTLEDQTNYWKNQLADVTKLNFPTDYTNVVNPSNDGNSVLTTINKNLLDKLKLLSTNNGSTLYITLLSAFKILLYKYTGQQDICVGTPVAGRTSQEIENLIGFFINMLVIRSEVKPEINFTKFLSEVKNTSLDAYTNQEIPFEKVVEATVKQRDISDRNPLYQVLFNFQNTPRVQEILLGDLEVDFIEPSTLKVKADLHFIVAEHPGNDGLILEVEYPTDSYKKSTIERLVSHYIQLLDSVVENPMLPISRLGILDTDETIQLHYDFNKTALRYSKEKSVIAVFKEQVIKTPNNIALAFEGETMTYEDLDKKSNKVASYMQATNITEGSHIGILFNRGFEMIISIIGILKSGATYVPLDPSLPLNRLSFIIEDAAINTILYKEEALKAILSINEDQFIQIDELLASNFSYRPVTRNITSTAYIMYTSGTTGTPKGILITDENILTLVYDKDAIQIQSDDRVLQWSNYAFDGATYEIFGSLLSGASLFLIPNSYAANIADLATIVKGEKLTVAFLTTALFNSFVDYDLSSLNTIRILLFGGEQVSVNHVERAFEALGADVLIHVYGPTETTTYATYHPIKNIPKQAHTIPIGKPLSNTQLYVLDTEQQLVPIGVAGELYIGGSGVAKGYLNRADLTTEHFIKSPFKVEDRLYRTGDLVRWSEEGNIEFIGRTDNQVKINGYRIELGEIETVLFEDASVLTCCILVKQDANANKRLVCYIVGDLNFEKEKTQNFLQEKLPNYMVPSIWVVLDQMPLNSNGKIDRKALPEPDMSLLSSSEYVEPTNAVEEKLVSIWQELLSIDKIGIHDNFFEIGGHSILATRVISMIRKELAIEVPVKLMFTQPTIARFASQLSNFSKNTLLPEI